MIRITISLAAILFAAVTAPAHATRQQCGAPDSLLDLGARLTKVERRVARHEAVTIVAIGSSSTAGAGASNKAATYPARLAAHWPLLLPYSPVTVINSGVGGEEVKDTLMRFGRDVEPTGADLVLWQLGVNDVLRRTGIANEGAQIAAGIARLKATGADLVLIDLQYAPRVLADPDHPAMLRLLQSVARETGSGLFRRFAVMRHWQASGQIAKADLIAGDGLHLTDVSYDCWASALATALVRSLSREAMAATQERGALLRP